MLNTITSEYCGEIEEITLTNYVELKNNSIEFISSVVVYFVETNSYCNPKAFAEVSHHFKSAIAVYLTVEQVHPSLDVEWNMN